MDNIRKVKAVSSSRPTLEGAGVRLKRAFGFQRDAVLDPFLLLDEFGSNNPEDYLQGFPWHPHRGIETITYMLNGTVEHADSLGNAGVISAGDVQWMTAGSGIIHQEMPQGQTGGMMRGFQLWANLPAAHKMMHPRYQDLRSDQIPLVQLNNGVEVRVICGEVHQVRGPVTEIITDPEYLDVSIPAGESFSHPVAPGYTAFAYVFGGAGIFEPGPGAKMASKDSLVILTDGDGVEIRAGAQGVRFLFLSGRPIREPVAWYGPIVMNTEAELRVAFDEYRSGTFLKHQ